MDFSGVFEACMIGDIKAVKRLADVKQALVDSDGACCLHYAARGGSLSVVEYLVKSLNLSVLERTRNGATALHDAAAKGNTAVVKWLVEEGKIDVDDKDGSGLTALHLAARYCHYLTVEWLLDEGCAEASVRSNTDALPLHFAVVGGDLNCVKTLVDENPRLINMQMNNGVAPVYLASQAGHLEILKFLISKKGATKVKAYDAMSCLHAAAQNGHLEVVKWLVTVDKCNPNDRDFDGTTPLHFAAGRGHADVIRWLLKEGGARVTLDNLGGSPLHTAAELGELQCIQALLDCGCDVNLTDNAGLTAGELADKCEQTEAAALIRGEITLAQLIAGSSDSPSLPEHPSHKNNNTFPPAANPPRSIEVTTSNTKIPYLNTSLSPSLPPPPVHHLRSTSATPSTSGSPITPPTPICEDENDPVSALRQGHSLVSPLTGTSHSNSNHQPIKRTVSRVSVDSSASNFGIFEQPEAGVIHTVIAEIHKTPNVAPPTPRQVTSSAVPGHGSLNSTQESILFSNSSSLSQDEYSPVQDRKHTGQKPTLISSSFNNAGSPPLAHSTLSNKRDLSNSGSSTNVKDKQNNSIHTFNVTNSTNQDSINDIQKFQYYSTPYKEDFNAITKSSFAQAKALFQNNRAADLHICPDSGEICSKSNTYYSPRQESTNYKVNTKPGQESDKNNKKSLGGNSSSKSEVTSLSQNDGKAIISTQRNYSSITVINNKRDNKEGNQIRSMSEQRKLSDASARTENVAASVHSNKDNMLKELRSKGLPIETNSTSKEDHSLVNGHAHTNSANSNHVGERTDTTPHHLIQNGSKVAEDDRSRNSRSFSRSSSGSSISSQPFSPIESKHNLIADIQSAVSGTSNLSLRRAKGRGEGVSMVYQSKNKSAQQEVKVNHTSSAEKFDPKNFLDQVEKVDSSGRGIPEWRRQVLAKHLAEKAQKEFEEQKTVEDYEARFKDMPLWKRALIERKEAQAREENASNKT